MSALARSCWRGVTAGVGAAARTLGGPSLASCAGPAAGMALWRSAAVRAWVEKQPRKLYQREPWRVGGPVMAPRLSRRKQSLNIKNAIRAGEFKLEPTVMSELPYFKGHMRQRNRPMRLALVAAKMAEMPKLIAEYRRAKKAAHAKKQAENRFK